ncbi:GGDEF domain-containing protein [Thaumasiovibrio subtropicus]|uniref:GGDEF domain-containing protein n=1 Tax=Thaumasiovibrio subtropicus TaxID=1891207 RepID=UPI000B358F2B|nr:GGDEF domain-containing protein [Thaumasiovibrio subtropicus]
MDQFMWTQSVSSTAEQTMPMRRLESDQRLLVLQKLQGKLDLSLLMETFIREVEKQIDISRLIWDFEDTCSIIRRGQPSEYRHTFTLKYAQHSLGSLQYFTPYALDRDEVEMLHQYHRLLAGPLMMAIEYQRVKNMALQDHLTGIGNRTSYEHDIEHAIAISQRHEDGLILMAFDLDNFKQVNDMHGHSMGDDMLVRFAQLLKQAIRTSDRCYRLGGDEFLAIIQPTCVKSARVITQRLVKLIAEDQLLPDYNVGTSFGYSYWKKGDDARSLYERADANLYENKRFKKARR